MFILCGGMDGRAWLSPTRFTRWASVAGSLLMRALAKMSGAFWASTLSRKASDEVGNRLGRCGTLKCCRGLSGWALAGMRGRGVVGCFGRDTRWATWLAAASRRGKTSDVMMVAGVCRLAVELRKAAVSAGALLCQEARRRGVTGSCGSPTMARRARPRR